MTASKQAVTASTLQCCLPLTVMHAHHTYCLFDLQGDLFKKFKEVELLALIIGAAGHDVGHPGRATLPGECLRLKC